LGKAGDFVFASLHVQWPVPVGSGRQLARGGTSGTMLPEAHMDIKELINNGWARHDKESAALATDMEVHTALAQKPEHVAAYLQLSNHTIGEHLRDWPRACRLAEKLMQGREASQALATSYSNLAVAQYLGGNVPDALASETLALRFTDGEPVSMIIRTRTMVASGLIGSKRLEEGARLYHAALDLARAQEGKLACDQALAMTSNNLASELMEKADRSDAERELMLTAAEASREFWLKCGTWENEERAEYLFALIYNKLGDPDAALEHAAKGLDVIARNGEEPVDEAFFNLTMADAFRSKQERAHYQKALERADELAEDFPEAGLKSWFAGERAKVEWKG
jgi:tetratricopeptide (TPR) repeat protein